MRDSSQPGLALIAAGISLSMALSGCSSPAQSPGSGDADTGGTATAAAKDSAEPSSRRPVPREAKESGQKAGNKSGGQTAKDKAQRNDYVLEIAQRLAKQPWDDDRLDFSLGFEYAVVELPGEPYSLLFERAFLEEDNGVAKVAVLDPKKKKMVSEYEDYLGLGVASVGGYRGRIHPSADGTQLLYVTTRSGTGATEVQRVSAPGGHVKLSPVAQGRWDKLEHMWGEEIQWQQLPSAANPGRSGRKPRPTLAENNPQSQGGARPNPVAPTGNSPQTAEGGIIRLSGTVRTLGYQEVLDLQGINDPNLGYSYPKQFTVFVLDSPAPFTARSSGSREMLTRQIKMVSLPLGYQGNKYEGQHLTVDFDTTDAWWPGGTDLPYGQPRLDGFQVVS